MPLLKIIRLLSILNHLSGYYKNFVIPPPPLFESDYNVNLIFKANRHAVYIVDRFGDQQG